MSSSIFGPARSFIIKLTERCNIACKYCYVFELGGSALTKPRYMTFDIFHQTLLSVRAHMLKHGMSGPHLVFHGGEPLLIGKTRFKSYLREVDLVLGAFRPIISLQSNGLLIDDGWLQLFKEHAIHVGISFDGTPVSHDRHRVTHKGEGTSERTVAAIKLMQEHAKESFAGILCVVDPLSSGADTIRFLTGLGLKSFDLLLPEANWQNQPPHPVSPFLKNAFDAWFLLDDASISIRLFADIIGALLGASASLDVFGGVLGSAVTIDTDGELAVNDVLQICDEHSSYDVAHHAIDDLMNISNFPWLQRPLECSKCRIREVCGSGHPAHRYDGNDYSKRTVYCEDLKDIVGHIGCRIYEILGKNAGSEYPRLLEAIEALP